MSFTRSISLTLSIIAVAALAVAPSALAEEVHADIWVSARDGALFTAGWDHASGQVINASQRVFEGELGIDPDFPFSGDEPGIGSNLLGITITMNVLQGLGAWNGDGFDASSAFLTASYGGQSGSTNAGGSFSFVVTNGLDLHPEYTLAGASGDPVNGIYLASFTFSAAGYQSSEVLYTVLNLGESEASHEAAVEWAEANLVPAPGALALLGAAGLLRRRRA